MKQNNFPYKNRGGAEGNFAVLSFQLSPSFCPSTYLPTTHLIAEWFSEGWRAQTFFTSIIKT